MTDRFVVRAVALGLVCAFVGCLGGIVFLAQNGSNHDVLDNLAAVALGALAGFLAKTNSEVQQVQVTNPVSDPLPTTDVPAQPKRKRTDRGAVTLEGILVALVILAAAIWLGAAIHPLFLLLLLLLVFLVLA